MPSPKTITTTIAAQFIAAPKSFDLRDYQILETDAAQMLALGAWGDSTYHKLFLDGITTLSDAAAQELGKFHGSILSMNGLTNLSVCAAQALVSRRHHTISLHGLTALPVAVAQALAPHPGCLVLNGLSGLSDESAAALAQHSGSLDLDRLTELSDLVACALFVSRCANTSLNGLKTLSGLQAAQICTFNATCSLHGLTTLSEDAVWWLAKCYDWISLTGEVKDHVAQYRKQWFT